MGCFTVQFTPMKNALFVLLIVLNGFYLSGQNLHIAQDIGHCSYGLKNDSGKWVVKPVYQQIESAANLFIPINGWIVTYDGMYYGVLDSIGGEVFPASYAAVSFYEAWPEKNIFEVHPKTFVTADNILRFADYPNIVKENDLYFFFYGNRNYPARIGFADSLGNVMTQKSYHTIYAFENGHAGFSDKNGKIGYLDKKGNEIIPAKFDYRQISPSTQFGVYLNNDSITGFFRWSDNTFIPMSVGYVYGQYMDWRSYAPSSNTFWLGKKKNKYGLLDDQGNCILPPIYDSIEPAVNGICRVMKDGKVGLVSTHGKILLAANCDNIEDFKEDYSSKLDRYDALNHCVIFEQKGKYGLFSDKKGVVMKASFSAMGWNENDTNMCWALKGKQVHAFQVFNGVVTEISFRQLIKSNQVDPTITLLGYLQTVQVDRSGNLMCPIFPWVLVKEDDFAPLPDGCHTIQGKNGFGIMNVDSDNPLIVPAIFEAAGTFGKFLQSGHGWETFDDGFFYVQTFGGHYGVYSPDGKMIVDTLYTSMNMISSDSFWIAQTSKGEWHLIDRKGKVVAVSERWIQSNNQLGFYIITRNGHEDLFNGLTEKFVAENKFVNIEPLPESVFIVEDDLNKVGVMDSSGTMLIPCKYFNITSPANGIVFLYSDSGMAVANFSGKIISPSSHVPLAFRPLAFDTILSLRDYIVSENSDDNNTIVFADTSWNKTTNRIANNFLLDSLAEMYTSPENFASYEMITIGQDNVFWENEWYSGMKYAVEAVTPISFSISKYYYESGHGSYHDEYDIRNFLIRHDSIIPIELNDILRTDLSYQAINDTIRKNIAQSNSDGEDEFFFDCSNPQVLSPSYFTIDSSGITVYYINANPQEMVDDSQEDIFSRMESVTLSWSLMGKYLKPGTDFKQLCGTKKH